MARRTVCEGSGLLHADVGSAAQPDVLLAVEPVWDAGDGQKRITSQILHLVKRRIRSRGPQFVPNKQVMHLPVCKCYFPIPPPSLCRMGLQLQSSCDPHSFPWERLRVNVHTFVLCAQRFAGLNPLPVLCSGHVTLLWSIGIAQKGNVAKCRTSTYVI